MFKHKNVKWGGQRKSLKKICTKIILPCIASYAVALMIFYPFYTPHIAYVGNELVELQDAYKIIYANLYKYFSTIYNDLGKNTIFYITILLCVIFIIKHTISAKNSRILSLFISGFGLVLMIVCSFGLYVFISTPLYAPRAFIGLGAFVAIIAIDSIPTKPITQKWLIYTNGVIIVAMAQYLLMFANYYGQALKSQNEHQRFRYMIMLGDLSRYTTHDEQISLYITNGVGYASGINNAMKHYPLIKRLTPNIAGDWLPYIMIKHYDMNIEKCENTTIIEEILLLDSRYHKITQVINEDKSKCYKVEFYN